MTTAAAAADMPRRADARILWIGIFLLSGALYGATADRGPQWQDSGWQQWRILTGTLAHSEGLALTHPLHFWLGRAALKLLPMLEPAFAITLVSSISAAIAIANLAATLVILTRSVVVALVSAAAMMLSHTLWQHATHTESYGLVLALLTAEWLCLAKYCETRRAGWLLGMALANGLGVANHMLAALSTPVVAVLFASLFHVKQVRASVCFTAIGLWVLGSLPYTSYVLCTGLEHGDLGGALHSALFGTYAPRVLNVQPSLRMIGMALAFVAYNFPGLTLLLAAYAMIGRTDAPRLIWRAMWAWFVIYFLFAVRYAITDQYSFLFPAYAALSVFAGLGLADICRAGQVFETCRDSRDPTSSGRSRKLDLPYMARHTRAIAIVAALTALWMPAVYWSVYKLASARGVMAEAVGRKPYRDGWRTFFVPWGVGETSAERVNREAFALAGPGGMIYVGDSMMEHALRYQQLVGRAPPVAELILGNHVEQDETSEQRRARLAGALRDRRPLVLVPHDRENPEIGVAGARWERRGDLYLLTGLD